MTTPTLPPDIVNQLHDFLKTEMTDVPVAVTDEIFTQLLEIAIERAYMDSIALSHSDKLIDMLTAEVTDPEQTLSDFVRECPDFINALKHHIDILMGEFPKD